MVTVKVGNCPLAAANCERKVSSTLIFLIRLVLATALPIKPAV